MIINELEDEVRRLHFEFFNDATEHDIDDLAQLRHALRDFTNTVSVQVEEHPGS